MSYPLVQELRAEGIPVKLVCEVLGFSRQAFYEWEKQPCCDRDLDDAYVANALVDAHAEDPEFGYRFLADEIHDLGHRASERRVWRLCSEHKIFSTTVRKGRAGGKGRPGPAVHDDLVNRDFTAETPDTVWLTDITEHPTAEGKLYVCAIKDVCSNRIVGYASGPRMTARLATAALQLAVVRRNPMPRTLTVHSDRGAQFRSRAFRRELDRAAIAGSMGRVASAGDNAAMESFFSLLQKNVLNRQTWATRDDLAIEISVWIEATYNRRRRQRNLGKLTPIEYELTHHQAA